MALFARFEMSWTNHSIEIETPLDVAHLNQTGHS